MSAELKKEIERVCDTNDMGCPGIHFKKYTNKYRRKSFLELTFPKIVA